MTLRPFAVAAALLLAATPAHAHWLDAYLQATTLQLESHRVLVQLRLTPGVAVVPAFVASVDVNADGVISESEAHAYARRVVLDLALRVDGTALPLRLSRVTFENAASMKEGLAVIAVEADAVVPDGGRIRTLRFENHHLRSQAVYLVNALMPRDTAIRITVQHRSYQQDSYSLEYTQGAAVVASGTAVSSRTVVAWLVAALLLVPAAWLTAVHIRKRRRPPPQIAQPLPT